MTKENLLQHYFDYPQAEVQDLFKFLHQSVFGPGHLIADRDENFKRLQAEVKTLDITSKEKIIDFLQPRLCRLHLQVLNQTSLNITTLQRFFEISATTLQGDVEDYHKKIDLLRTLCANGDLPLAVDAVDHFKKKIITAPTRPFRHSETYREAYKPAYRVVDKKFCDLLPLFSSIDKLMHEKSQILIAIDGDCAAGKTTLAGLLAQVYDCNIVHIDHFFLQPEQRTEKRLQTPGGNIDYERFTSDVLLPLRKRQPFSYQPFNCMTQEMDAPIPFSPQKLTIIEGSYSTHPELASHYDLKIFLSIPEDIQLERILKRNGQVMFEKFKNLWIPMEKKYAQAFEIQKNCDLHFDYLDY